MSASRKKNPDTLIGLIDADLLDNGTRHPNLVLLKLAGYFRANKIRYRLIYEENEDIEQFSHIYVSQVFTFTRKPVFVAKYEKQYKSKFTFGGTGLYATVEGVEEFKKKREQDFVQLEKDPRLRGLDMKKQMPDYTLYDEFIEMKVASGRKAIYYKDYKNYSIGFLTRGCFRRCSFCVNRLETCCHEYSRLEDFVDVNRRCIYLWDDNFLAAPHDLWKTRLQELMATNKPFQFRQGLDERLLTEESAQMLSQSRYHGDMIFAFDHWSDREIVEEKLKLWRKYCPTKGTKFYLFCGYEMKVGDDEKLYQDVCEIFYRIRILMKYGCLGYVMRHEDYHRHELSNIYVQIARWCNQPQFYKKMSFEQFIYQNQKYTKTDRDCMSMRTYKAFLKRFEDREDELLDLFRNVRYEELLGEEYRISRNKKAK
ncbi:MAG: hypothetical protein MJZ77_05600 [Bacteroidales bacterium]|nr:hypothetical protein [Bacteroidales bacterium]